MRLKYRSVKVNLKLKKAFSPRLRSKNTLMINLKMTANCLKVECNMGKKRTIQIPNAVTHLIPLDSLSLCHVGLLYCFLCTDTVRNCKLFTVEGVDNTTYRFGNKCSTDIYQ